MKFLHILTYILVIVGALNWGLIGIFNFNLVMALFGSMPMLEQWIYILVGLSAVWQIITHNGYCMMCSGMNMKGMDMDMKIKKGKK